MDLDGLMDAIALDNLSKSFPRAGRVVDRVTLNIRQGEFVTLLGPSGCGKTTTLRLIAGFEFPDEGSVQISDIDVTNLPPYRRPVNTVFQDYALFPHMTVEQNIGYGLWIDKLAKREIRDRVEAVLQMVGLQEKAAARPQELSGGQRQRVALARAIVRRPKVLLLDEPLSALDANLREAMQVELKHLHQQLGMTFILVTHDQTEAMVMSDRILIMEAGRVVQDGTPAELYDAPVSSYVANFIGTSNLVPARVVGISGTGMTVQAGEVRLKIQNRGYDAAIDKPITLAIRPERAEIRSAAPAGTDLQPTFPGKIIENLFHGDKIRTHVDIGTGVPFLVDTQLKNMETQRQILAGGTACRVWVDEPSIVAFESSQSR
jgi:spermidine/putrescine ABC transporter ATP-binding subunit